jgi:penicillin amidase
MRIDLRKWSVAIVPSTILVLAAVVYAVLAAALPRRSGEARLAEIDHGVTIELDDRAIPRIRAASLEDALRAQGFMHAQERFFQMDLTRRSAAGELAELFGERALPLDRAQRVYRFRARARELLAALPAQHAAWLAAYVQGVNAGLADLKARPPEYWFARSAPAAWAAEDSLLVVYSLYTMLSNNEAYERGQGVMRETLPASVYEFLTPTTTRFDRPLAASSADPTGGYAPLPIPPPDDVDLRNGVRLPGGPAPWIDPPLLGPASNQWAVDSTRTVQDVAMVANDPHLTLRIPNVFYRSELYWQDRVARGVSIPGLPGILLGANDSVAWGATVSNADQADWVAVELDPLDPSRYRVPGGSEPFRTIAEDIAVRGGTAEQLEIRHTRWGPIVDHDWRGRPLALHASWLAADGLDLDLLELMLAHDVDEGAEVIRRWSGPSLNWTFADTQGGIAWAVNGPLPRRTGFDGSQPRSWADGTIGWQGERERPSLIGHRDGVLYSANNRTLAVDEALALSRMWMPSLRAKRIDDLLAGTRRFTESDFLAMQLDTRAEAYDAVRDIVLEVIAENDPDPLLARARGHVLEWSGAANAEDVGFRLLHVFYRTLVERLLAPLLAPALQADPRFVYRWPLADEPLRRLLEERPAHLVAADVDWPTWLRQILREALESLEAARDLPGLDATWGEANALDVAHPLGGVPVLGRWLRLRPVPQPGSFVSLRVAGPNYGALFRMAVAPAHPQTGILQMSGGQSGHFLSPNFKDQQADWVTGTATPFLAGPTVATFTLR